MRCSRLDYEVKKCIDAGTEFCPCHLAEARECIICSQLSGKDFCDCINWKGTCILQEYYSNGNKPKGQRKTYISTVEEAVNLDNKILKLSIEVPRKLAEELAAPGSFVFIRKPNTMQFYDVPISIMRVNLNKNIITIAIEIRGIKTKDLLYLQSGHSILVRGPFFNGVFGINYVNSLKNSKAIVVARGIGAAPAIPVMEKLLANNNQIYLILDKTPFDIDLIEEHFNIDSIDKTSMEIFDNGELTEEFAAKLNELIDIEGYKLIHCAAADIISYLVTNKFKHRVNLSCCNNSKMCCGEGVCGSCSTRYSGHQVKRLCKIQCEPQNLFEGRRLI